MKKIQEANIVLKNATIFDPKNNIVGEGSVAILKNKIAAVGDTSMYSGSLEIDVKKRIVCPGVIDIHTHIYPNGTWNGIPADLYAIPMGITAAVDAGSSGVANYKGLLSEMDLSHIHKDDA